MNEKSIRRLKRKRLLRQAFITEAMLERGFSMSDVLNNDMERFAYLLEPNERYTSHKRMG